MLAATQAEQAAYELPSLEHGLFSYLLLKGIKEQLADLDADGHITFRELARYITSQVEEWVLQHPIEQQPVFASSLNKDITLCDTAWRKDISHNGARYFCLEVEETDLFARLSERVESLNGPSFAEGYIHREWAVYDALTRKRSAGTWFSIYRALDLSHVQYTCTDKYAMMSRTATNGEKVHLHGVFIIHDHEPATAYKLVFDMSLSYPPLIQYWFFDLTSVQPIMSALYEGY